MCTRKGARLTFTLYATRAAVCIGIRNADDMERQQI